MQMGYIILFWASPILFFWQEQTYTISTQKIFISHNFRRYAIEFNLQTWLQIELQQII